VGGCVLGGVVLALLIGGGIHRTDCVTTNGLHVTSWGAEGVVPCLWCPRHGYAAHMTTRFVAGKVGMLSDVSR
jgi:hypothetical protein